MVLLAIKHIDRIALWSRFRTRSLRPPQVYANPFQVLCYRAVKLGGRRKTPQRGGVPKHDAQLDLSAASWCGVQDALERDFYGSCVRPFVRRLVSRWLAGLFGRRQLRGRRTSGAETGQQRRRNAERQSTITAVGWPCTERQTRPEYVARITTTGLSLTHASTEQWLAQ